jgi:hypothetical protein
MCSDRRHIYPPHTPVVSGRVTVVLSPNRRVTIRIVVNGVPDIYNIQRLERGREREFLFPLINLKKRKRWKGGAAARDLVI